MQYNDYINGLVQERRNSSALAMELYLSCTNPLIYYTLITSLWHHMATQILIDTSSPKPMFMGVPRYPLKG